MKLFVVAALIAATACAGRLPSEPPLPVITVSDAACTSDGLGALFPETFVLSFGNITTDSAFFDIWLMDDQSSYEQLAAHITEEQRRLRLGEPFMGHPRFAYLVGQRYLGPLEKSTLEMKGLKRGTYGIVCGRKTATRTYTIFAVGPFVVP